MTPAVRRSLVGVLALAVLAAGGAGVWRWRKLHRKPPVEFDTANVDRGRIIARVTATGTLSALVTVQVGTQVSGTIQKLFVDFNSPVKKGQLIAKIDPQLIAASLDQARANFEAAQGNLLKAEAQERDAGRQFERSKGLLDRKLIAQADFDTSQANLEVMKGQTAAARGSLAQAKAALYQAQVNLDMTKIVSPTDGTVISRSVDVGQTVAASLAAPTLFVIAKDLREMQVDTSVAEADVGRLSPGMAATFTVDAFPGERFRGKVRQIRNAPTTLQNVVTYDAVIDVANPDLKLRPGMTANITFIAAEKDDVLRVPNAAMRFRPTPEIFAALGLPVPPAVREASERKAGGSGAGSGAGGGARSGGAPGGGARAGGSGAPGGPGGPAGGRGRPGGRGDGPTDRRSVWAMRDGKPQMVSLRIGLSDGSMTEIVEGELREGEVVVVDASVADGQTDGAAPTGPGGMRRLF
jgi:HlyD family secretion protein